MKVPLEIYLRMLRGSQQQPVCSKVSKKTALNSDEWKVGQILSASKLLLNSFLTSLIANELDKEVDACAKLPVCAKVKAGLNIAEY